MARKLLSVIILLSMGLHCASRLGGLSYLYERRHDIAWSIGLLSEKPIAVCSSTYHSDKTLTILSPERSASVPAFVQSHEINLFFVDLLRLPQPAPYLLYERSGIRPSDHYDLTTADPIFHPPLG